MVRKALLAWAYGILALLCLSMILLYVVIPLGINLGKEREARDFSVIFFIIGGLAFFGNVGFWTYKLSKEPAAQRRPAAPAPKSRPDASKRLSLVGKLLILGGVLSVGAIQIAAAVFVLLLMYGIAVIIFRYAYGVELPNPFQ